MELVGQNGVEARLKFFSAGEAPVLATTPSTCCKVSSSLAGSESALSTAVFAHQRAPTKRHKSVAHEPRSAGITVGAPVPACQHNSVLDVQVKGVREGEQARSGIITSN